MTQQRYFIIGLPGAGKSSLLNQFSAANKIDLDEAITQNYNTAQNGNQSIHEIFKDLDHLTFRNLERKILKQVLPEIQLISCGGGTPCYFDNMDYMLRTGTVLWLQTPLEMIVERIEKSGRPIPILDDQNRHNQLSNDLTDLLEKRSSFYKRAHYQLNENEILHFLTTALKK